jgi:hypothetical protein
MVSTVPDRPAVDWLERTQPLRTRNCALTTSLGLPATCSATGTYHCEPLPGAVLKFGGEPRSPFQE